MQRRDLFKLAAIVVLPAVKPATVAKGPLYVGGVRAGKSLSMLHYIREADAAQAMNYQIHLLLQEHGRVK